MAETIQIQDELLPKNLFILPIGSKPLFPGLFLPLLIIDKEDMDIVNQAIAHGGLIGALLQNDEVLKEAKEEKDYSKLFYKVGTVCRILKSIKLPDGGMNIFVSTLQRFEVQQFYPSGPYLVAGVKYLTDEEGDQTKLKAWTRELSAELKNKGKATGLFTEENRLNMVNIDDPSKFADYMASILQIKKEESQQLLETLNVKERIELVLTYIQREKQIAMMQSQIQNRVNKKLEKTQRDYFLREELKAIQKELGIGNTGKLDLVTRLEMQLADLELTGEAAETVYGELSRMQALDPNNPDYSVIRAYIETIIALPWKDRKQPKFNIEDARKILERDHYGMREVKDRILEFLAVRKKKGDNKGAILCLVGPPGVGKTSVGISIAHALKKDYYRFSVGGMRDEAEIKGHRRTYIGALPGKIIQGLKSVKAKDPVFLIDEIDKMGQSYQGDPASALLEVLDPEQNVTFRDRYLDIPFDISHILFIVTANSLETIPQPLLDRMEIIELSGYTSNEKLNIGKKYLLPKSLKKNGLTKAEIKYPTSTLLSIADEYAREAGVRNFEKALNKINRKVALDLELNPELKTPIAIDKEAVIKYLGQPIFVADEILKADKIGTAIGLAWTNFGGDTLMIEAEKYPGMGELKVTGQLGDVMRESVSIAWTYIKMESELRGLNNSFFTQHDFHLHIPEGATPKDGPSAGITLTCALYSLMTEQLVKPNLAMTGELTLTGKVMPIGGLKEKVLAARRNQINTILIPKFNKRDLDKLEADVTEGITFHLVNDMQEVLNYAFENDKTHRLDEKEMEEYRNKRNAEVATSKKEDTQSLVEALTKVLSHIKEN
ncbi:MAG: endopeptidase La [Spirochaetales bacterium]|nr:endopeptidase La [Spirochaetales bacterium]